MHGSYAAGIHFAHFAFNWAAKAYSIDDSKLAMPRKLKKPATSVTVVRMMDDD
jgi:hypothetical protein